MNKIKLGLALTGSYCTFDSILPVARALAQEYDLTVIMSDTSASTDTRFGCAENMKEQLCQITGKDVITTVVGAEPIGPKKLFDVLAVAPCTGNTIAKLACGIADSSVTMACKAHLRNQRPLVISISSNDALSTNAGNIGQLLNRKNIYFVPFGQDDHQKKPCSVVADLSALDDTIQAALEGVQIQPVLIGPK